MGASNKRRDPPPADVQRVVDLMETETKAPPSVPLPVAVAAIPLSPKRATTEPRTLQEYSVNEKDVLFIRRLEETGRLADSYIRQLPPMKEVLSYVASLPEKPLWYRASQDAIINSRSLNFPDMDVLTRDYIREFLRMGDLPCNNPNCESERLGKFRIRQLPLRGGSTWCFLCHLFYTNKLYFQSLNRKNDDHRVFQIHSFMVQVDVEGEYRLDKCLMGDKDVRGLYGPFPLYNCNNYVVTDYNGVKGWAESDTLVFRLSQTVS